MTTATIPASIVYDISMLRAGDLIDDHYEILAFIGEGGMGSVFKALDRRLERTIAIKVLREDDDPEFVRRLRREALTTASLSHPNVVSVYDVGTAGGLVYLTMEFVEGVTLRQLVGSTDYHWHDKLRWMLDVARALEAAHAAGLVHRDVKPENVVIRKDGVVKVLDFGIARRPRLVPEDEPSAAMETTGRGQLLGTPAYMAPEQLRGHEAIPATDQFAWGVTAYEVLAGVRPWKKSPDLVSVVATMLSEPPRSLRGQAHCSDVPVSVEKVILRALDKLPEGRYPSLGHLIAVLEPFTSQTMINADRVTLKPLPHAKDEEAFHATTRVPTVRSAGISRPPDEEGPTSRRLRKVPRWAWGVAALGLLGAGFALRGIRRPPVAAWHVSTSPLAEQAYREGEQLVRDGAQDRAERAFGQATEADPDCAAAHLELALLLFEDRKEKALEHYQAAFANRAHLAPRDAEMLDASEPYLRAHSDLEEWQTRLLRLSRKYPKDPEVLYYLGLSRERMFDYEGARDAYSKCINADPHFVVAYGARARAENLLGDAKSALEDYDRCLRASPVATVCLRERTALLAHDGACARSREDAERWVSMDAKEPEAQTALAAALVAQGTPTPAVEEVLKRAWALYATTREPAKELRDRARLAAVQGDFIRAEALALAWDRALAPDAGREAHAESARLQVQVLRESGDGRGAALAAKTFLERRASFASDAWSADPSAWFLGPLARGGGMSKPELAKARSEWLRAEEMLDRQKERARQATFRWTVLHGHAVEPDDVREALAALPLFQPLSPASTRDTETDYILGRTLALGGRAAEAGPYLSAAVTRCSLFQDPFSAMGARYEWARLLENTDRARAKELYAEIVKQWGHARPKSNTALLAARRLEELAKGP